MEGHGPRQMKRPNAFSGFVDKRLGYQSSGADADRDQKKLKPNSEAPLSTLEQQVPSSLPNLLVSAFKDNPAGGGLKFKFFVSRSYSPPTSTSPPPGQSAFQ